MAAGRIILLNGSSSAGKTTLAITLQQLLPDPWHHIALDQFRDGMGGRYRGLNSPPGTPGARGLNVVPVSRGQRSRHRGAIRRSGQASVARHASSHRSVRSRRQQRHHRRSDVRTGVFCSTTSKALAGFEVLFVGVRCPIDVVNAREAKRPGRFPGTATSHFDVVHKHCVYDIEVDTGAATPRQCAEQIIARLEDGRAKDAFDRLRAIAK